MVKDMKNDRNRAMEKRESIRIKDRVLMGFKEISEQTYEEKLNEYMEGLRDPWVESCHPTVQKGIKKHLKRLKEKDSDLAAILEVLDQKLTLLLNLVNTCDSSNQQDRCTRVYKVDLSAKGIGFMSKKEMTPGTILELYIGLLPEHYFFNCFGKVVRRAQQNDKFFTAVQFIWITEDDQEKLIEHIFSRQVLQLRLRRKKREQAHNKKKD